MCVCLHAYYMYIHIYVYRSLGKQPVNQRMPIKPIVQIYSCGQEYITQQVYYFLFVDTPLLFILNSVCIDIHTYVIEINERIYWVNNLLTSVNLKTISKKTLH